MSKIPVFPILSIVAAIAIIGLVVAFRSDAPKDLSSLSTREIATTCDPKMGEAFHIHPKLEIRIDGATVPIEGNIGVTKTCMTRLHTHEPDGTLHVESPEVRPFTLGDFFAVWGKTFNKDQILDHMATSDKKIRVTVNGAEVDTYENTLLKDKDQIVISYE